MELYLIRHGEALANTDDAARTLSERGRGEATRMARAMALRGESVARIRHSPKTRARETAEIFASALDPTLGCEPMDGLKPMDDPNIAGRELIQTNESIMLVGHLPHLSRLASLLLTGESTHELITLPPVGMVALNRRLGQWSLRWMLTPEIVREA